MFIKSKEWIYCARDRWRREESILSAFIYYSALSIF